MDLMKITCKYAIVKEEEEIKDVQSERLARLMSLELRFMFMSSKDCPVINTNMLD